MYRHSATVNVDSCILVYYVQEVPMMLPHTGNQPCHNGLKKLPIGTFVVGDNTYVCRDTLLIPFSGIQQHEEGNSNYNFLLSQLQIRIEMVFGMLVGNWRIFLHPLACGFKRKNVVTHQASQFLH
jgi:hypothetical protein